MFNPKKSSDEFKILKNISNLDRKIFVDKFTIITINELLLLNPQLFEDEKKPLIFGLKLYNDGSFFSGFLNEKKNEIFSYAIYKDTEGRKLMGML